MPRRRYLPGSLLELCRRYVQLPRSSYRRVVRRGGREIRYEAPAAGVDWSEERKAQEETRALSPSTVWRWVAFLGTLWLGIRKSSVGPCVQTPAEATRPMRVALPAGKYRHRGRRRVLIHCLWSVAHILGEKSFTGYATLYASACG